MCCAVGILGILGPRVLIVLWYLVDPARWAAVFSDGPLLPVLGFLLLPWTTFFYVLFWAAGGLPPLGWVFVILGVVADLGTYGGGVFGNKDKVQSFYR